MSLTNLQTFSLITGLMGCLMTLVIYFLKESYPKSIKGLDDWTIFPLLTFASSVLYGTQGKWHHLIAMALPNLLVVITLLIQLRGTYQHFGRNVSRKWIYGIFGPAIVFILWSSGKPEYFVHRLVFISGLTMAVLGSQLPLLWRHRRGSFATHFMLCTVTIIVMVMMLRAVTALIDPPQIGIYTYSPVQAVYLATYSFGVLLLSISGILLASEQLRKEMERLLKYDALTGALTRRAALEYAEDELARTLRLGSDFSVLMVDIDHFKKINDQYGHLVGDQVLKDFVHHAEQTLRRPAAVGRYGGEEFLVLLPDTSKEQAVQTAQRMQTHLRQFLLKPNVTVSMGVACIDHSKRDSLSAMIGRADDALYRAKNSGRDKIVVDAETDPLQRLN